MRHFDEYRDIDLEALRRAREDEMWALDQFVRCRECSGKGCVACEFVGAVHWEKYEKANQHQSSI